MIVLQADHEDVAVRLLQEGAVGIMPTDTIYGIVAVASNKKAVTSLYKAKHRQGKPGTVIAAHLAQLEALGIEASYLQKVAHFWPNALSIVLPDHQELAYLDQGKHSLAMRIPASAHIRALLEKTGPLLTSSANMPGQAPAQDIKQAVAYFGSRVDFYLDGGLLEAAWASTVVRLHTSGHIELLREGAVPSSLFRKTSKTS